MEARAAFPGSLGFLLLVEPARTAHQIALVVCLVQDLVSASGHHQMLQG